MYGEHLGLQLTLESIQQISIVILCIFLVYYVLCTIPDSSHKLNACLTHDLQRKYQYGYFIRDGRSDKRQRNKLVRGNMMTRVQVSVAPSPLFYSCPISYSINCMWLFKLKSVCVCSVASLCQYVDCSPPVSSVHRIFQARILEWVEISYSRRSSQPRHQTRVSCVSCTGRRILYHYATQEAQIKV